MTSTRIFFPRIWEDIDKSGTMRLRVFGGWVVYSRLDKTETMCFMPDPKHKWELVPEGSAILTDESLPAR